jgi:quinol monooxygenase YgiN
MLEFDNENIIHIEQRWKHRSFMEDHLRSDLFSALIGAIQVLSQSYEIRINESSRTEGMEAVQAAQAE